jgi:hypothetical protein
VNRKGAEYDSLWTKWSMPIRAIKQQEILDLQQRIHDYIPPKFPFNTIAFDMKLIDAVNKIAKAKGYSAVLDSKTSDAFVLWSTPGIDYINITSEICEELKIRK